MSFTFLLHVPYGVRINKRFDFLFVHCRRRCCFLPSIFFYRKANVCFYFLRLLLLIVNIRTTSTIRLAFIVAFCIFVYYYINNFLNLVCVRCELWRRAFNSLVWHYFVFHRDDSTWESSIKIFFIRLIAVVHKSN